MYSMVRGVRLATIHFALNRAGEQMQDTFHVFISPDNKGELSPGSEIYSAEGLLHFYQAIYCAVSASCPISKWSKALQSQV